MAGSLPITVIIPVKNEETNLPLCLAGLSRFACVIVVDSGSTDRTPAIAREYGAQVLEFVWDGKFPKKRNWALRHHVFTTEWVLFLDADECVTDAFCDEVAQRTQDSQTHGYWLIYDNYFMGRLLKHGDRMRKLALLRVGHGEYEHIDEQRWSQLDMEIHEHLVVDGHVGAIRSPIMHRDLSGLDVYYDRHNQYSTWEAARHVALRSRPDGTHLTRRQWLKYHLMTSWFLPPLYFLSSYVLWGGFLDGREGLSFGLSKMFYFYQIQFKVRELLANQDRWA